MSIPKEYDDSILTLFKEMGIEFSQDYANYFINYTASKYSWKFEDKNLWIFDNEHNEIVYENLIEDAFVNGIKGITVVMTCDESYKYLLLKNSGECVWIN